MSRKPLAWLAVCLVALVGARGFLSPAPLSAAGAWVNVTGNLAGMSTECGNVGLLSAVPGSGTVIAGVALKGLWANSGGTTWSHLGTGAGSATIVNRPSWIVYDPANPAVFWEAGIYNGGGIYKTTNSGLTFTQLGTIGHNDYVSVDFTDPNRQTLLAGGHEQSRTIYKSTDGGQNWTNVGSNLPAGYAGFSSNPLVINAQTYVVNGVGIYRTTNGGANWQQVSTQSIGGPPLVALNGTLFWAFWPGGMLKSTNAGLTWTPAAGGAGLRPIELPNGNLVSSGGSTLTVSTDGGSSWSPLGPAMPYSPDGVVYSPGLNAFFIWRSDCGGAVPANAVMRLDNDPLPPPTIPAQVTGLTVHE